MPRALSFDIGIHNLAFAIVTWEPNMTTIDLHDWGTIDVATYTHGSKALDDLSLGLIQALDERFSEGEFDVVILENQPVQKNPTMKSVQMVIYTYFQMRKAHMGSVGTVKLMSAINKSKWIPSDPVFKDLIIEGSDAKTAYKKNKQLSVQMIYALIHACLLRPSNTNVMEALDKVKKKDDMCDAAAQAVKHVLDSVPKTKRVTPSQKTS